MPDQTQQLRDLLHERFSDADSIPELRERLRDIEEELHATFAEELSHFIENE